MLSFGWFCFFHLIATETHELQGEKKLVKKNTKIPEKQLYPYHKHFTWRYFRDDGAKSRYQSTSLAMADVSWPA